MTIGAIPFGSAPFGSLGGPTNFSADIAETIGINTGHDAEKFYAIAESLLFLEGWDGEIPPWIIERLGLADAATSLRARQAEMIEGLYLQDMPTIALAAILSEGLVFSDAVTDLHAKVSVIAEVLLLSGAAESRLDAVASIQIAIALDDMARSGFEASMAETVAFAEAWTAKFDAAGNLVESLLLQDALTTQLRLVALIDERVNLGDAPTALAALQASVEEGISLFATIRLDGTEYSAWVLNTETNAATEYRNINFNSMATFAGRHWGGSDSGLFEIGVGDTDDGDEIEAFLRTGLSNMGTGKMKRLPSAYLGYKSDGTLMLKVVTTSEGGDKRQDWYQLNAQTATDTREGRIKLGRGLKSVYWGFEIANVDGADFELDSIELHPLILDRRI